MMTLAAIDGLVGSVEKVESKTVSVFEESDKFTELEESRSSGFFDQFNNLIEISYTIPNKHSQKTVNKFDSKNRLIETIVFYEDSLKYRREFSYNLEDSITETKFYDENNFLQDTHQPIYTNDGFRVEEVIYEPFVFDSKKVQGNINFTVAPEITVSFSNNNIYKSKAVYDSSDKLLEILFYKYKNRSAGKISVVYDDENKPIEIKKFGDDTTFYPNNLKRWQKNLFPVFRNVENSILTLRTVSKFAVRREFVNVGNCFVYGVPFDETSVKYNEKNRIREIQFHSTFFNNDKTTFEYDEKGNKTEKISYCFGNSISYFENNEYEYDAQDNWIKRKTLYKLPTGNMTRFMERTVLTYREIKYYNREIKYYNAEKFAG